jgi:hypothetical protein
MDNEPTLTINDQGDKYWWLNGNPHRIDGPAIEYANGNKSWRLHGKHHRVDGPAIEFTDGNIYWCLNGTQYYSDFDGWLEANKFISEEEKLMLKLIYG